MTSDKPPRGVGLEDRSEPPPANRDGTAPTEALARAALAQAVVAAREAGRVEGQAKAYEQATARARAEGYATGRVVGWEAGRREGLREAAELASMASETAESNGNDDAGRALGDLADTLDVDARRETEPVIRDVKPEDRSEPPPGYVVRRCSGAMVEWWWGVDEVDEQAPYAAGAERSTAVAACWAHRDAVLASVTASAPQAETPDKREAAIVRRLAGEWGEIEVGPTESIDDAVSHIHGAGTVIMRLVNEVGDWSHWARKHLGSKEHRDIKLREALDKRLTAAPSAPQDDDSAIARAALEEWQAWALLRVDGSDDATLRHALSKLMADPSAPQGAGAYQYPEGYQGPGTPEEHAAYRDGIRHGMEYERRPWLLWCGEVLMSVCLREDGLPDVSVGQQRDYVLANLRKRLRAATSAPLGAGPKPIKPLSEREEQALDCCNGDRTRRCDLPFGHGGPHEGWGEDGREKWNDEPREMGA